MNYFRSQFTCFLLKKLKPLVHRLTMKYVLVSYIIYYITIIYYNDYLTCIAWSNYLLSMNIDDMTF